MKPLSSPVLLPARENWLLSAPREAILEPDLPIIDPHHHLWDRPGWRYLFHDLLDDTNTGHNILGTVFVQARTFYRASGPEELQPIGETEYVNGVAAMSASGEYGPARLCAGIVPFADMMLGARVRDVLEAHIIAGGGPNGRLRGIRHGTQWDSDPLIQKSFAPPIQGAMGTKEFREGIAQLAPLNLSFDAFLLHPQIGELTDLARSFPDTRMVLNHVGMPLAIGPYEGKRDEVFRMWKASIQELATCQNVYVKLGGLGMRTGGFGFEDMDVPPTSQQVADAWKPYIETCIEAFGPSRSMFESNFPVDKGSCGYAALWNAFKRIASGASKDEKADLFAGAAARFYRLDL